MIRFNNDYNHGAHPAILKALTRTNSESYGGYGLDEWCEKAAAEIKKHLDCPKAAIHFMVGGTQTNFTVISALLRPYQSVISASSGHIFAHETGAVEATGHKVEAILDRDGKLTAAEIANKAESYRTSHVQEHIPQPKLVYISHPTEYGTIYSREELEEIRTVCDEYGLFLYVDGARMGYGLGSPESNVTLADFARLADVFYIGGTKCGALFGEAVVIPNPLLQTDFRSYIKQKGGMLAKGWLLGLQFYTLFKDGLYLDITKKAVTLAIKLRTAFAEKKIPAYIHSPTNQQFVVLTKQQMNKLAEKYVFEYEKQLAENLFCVRFCTSWCTTEEEVDALIADIKAL